jgi:mannose-6-phosphate isomerase-like protein (cupin superfamily)
MNFRPGSPIDLGMRPFQEKTLQGKDKNMIKHVKEHEVKGERFDPPHARTIKHLAAPWTLGTRNVWLGITEVDPGNASNLHSHDEREEIFYVISGQGKIRVADEEEAIEPGSCIYIPIGLPHQLINTAKEKLKAVAVTSPAFTLAKFDEAHKKR